MPRIELKPTYGSWQVLEEVEPKRQGRNSTRRVRVRCSLCWTVKVRNLYPLHTGQSKNCRCATRRHTFKVGQKVGLLTVKEVGVRASEDAPRKVRVRCNCGVEKLYLPNTLSRLSSCGCRRLRKGAASPLWGGHGQVSGTRWLRIQQDAARRGLVFEITIEDAWALFEKQGGRCALTGMGIRFVEGREDAHLTTASLDRIDNTKGYIAGNVQWLHKDINMMKGQHTQERFLALCRAVAGHLIQHILEASE